ncbi:MAG: flagellar M-ring protein FliF, partial [Bdellovibrionaceae bacterium]|nr:flagellar M-ring protein FliF [Pseudobdellovibrionaceae bacterium]
MKGMFSVLHAQLRDFFKSLTPIKRISVIASAAVAIAAIVTITLMSVRKDYVALIKDVDPAQTSAVIGVLESKKIPYQLLDSGRTIMVPHSFLPSSQMIIMSEVGSEKLSQGLELFDKQSFGTTTYEQRIKYQRALQGELIRSISTLESISRAKVILAIPEKKVFSDEAAVPTASVVVELHPGKALSEDQVRGITYLVANSVENMKSENVSVVDSRGKVLSKKSDESLGNSAELMDSRRKIENYFQERIESILSKVVGEGKVIARVNADLNNKQISKTEETVDPDKTAIKSSQSDQESVEGNRSNPTGVAGARAQLPGASENGNVVFNQDVKKEQKIMTFEVPKTVTNIVESAGSINRLSIAVVVDGVVKTVGAKGKETQEWQPRSNEEIARIETIVKNVVGFSDSRGDAVKIESFQFAKEDFTSVDEITSELYRQKMIRFALSWIIAIIGLILVYLFVVRPFTSWLTDSFQDSIDDMLPKTIEELEE